VIALRGQRIIVLEPAALRAAAGLCGGRKLEERR
jgi:hypothetical protein